MKHCFADLAASGAGAAIPIAGTIRRSKC